MTFEEEGSKFEGIPMKYLGNDAIDSDPSIYSHNLENLFTKSIRSYILKDELDDVYAINKAMQYMMMMKDEDKHSETIKMLERNLELTILNRNQATPSAEERAVFVSKNKAKFSFYKLLLTLKSLSAYPLLTLNYIGGSLNAIMASILTVKQSIKNSMLKRGWFFTGIDKDHVDFSARDLAGGFAAWVGMTKDSMLGNLQENKTYRLLQDLRYLPSNFDWATNNSKLMTRSMKALDKSALFMFYNAPEEALATMVMVAQLKRMKISETHPDPEVRGKSLYDMYHVTKVTKNGVEIPKLVFGKKLADGTVEPVVRGVKNISSDPENPEYEEIGGVTSEEAVMLHHVYERIHGGYRTDERIRFEYGVFNQLFLQFRRFLPNVLRNVAMGAGKRESMGAYKMIGKDASGQEILEWQSRILEGRWRVFGNVLLEYLHLRHKYDNPSTSLQRGWNWFVGSGSNTENYRWGNLDNGQKEAFFDAVYTSTWLMAATLGSWMMFGAGTDDEDTLYRYYSRIIGDIAVTISPIRIAREVADIRPIAARQTLRVLDAITTMTWSSTMYALGQDGALTQDGVLRGWRDAQRALPVTAVWRKAQYDLDNWKTLQL